MVAASPMAEVSPNRIMIFFEVDFTHFDFLFRERGADGWSASGSRVPEEWVL